MLMEKNQWKGKWRQNRGTFDGQVIREKKGTENKLTVFLSNIIVA